MMYLGDYKAGSVVDFAFDTSLSGLPSTLSSITVKCYKGSSSTTEVTTGVTTTADFDTLTGFVHVTIDLSNAFYAAGSDIMVVLTAGTLGGQTIRRVLAMFSIENRCVNWAQVVSPSTTVALSGTSSLITSGTGTGQLDVTSGVIKANLAQILGTALTETAGLLAGAFKKFFNVASPSLTCLDINQTGDAYARLGAPAGASVSADVASIQADTDNIQTRIPSALDSNGFMKADVEDWKASAAPNMTGDAFARLGAAGAGLTALGDTRIAHLDADVTSRLAASGYTVPPTAAAITDAVWDELETDHTSAGSMGAGIASAAAAGDPWTAPLPGSYAAGTAGRIVGTNVDAAISTRLASGSYTAPDNAGVAAIKLSTDRIPSSPAAVADIAAAFNAMLADSIPTDGVRPTAYQALYMIVQFLYERSITGTQMTVKKPDGVTTLMTLTLGDASSPQSITRTT